MPVQHSGIPAISCGSQASYFSGLESNLLNEKRLSSKILHCKIVYPEVRSGYRVPLPPSTSQLEHLIPACGVSAAWRRSGTARSAPTTDDT